jgi:tetratricopeptide (TPR) repeat protein/cell division septation protein DedD
MTDDPHRGQTIFNLFRRASSTQVFKFLSILSICFIFHTADSCFSCAYSQDAFYSIHIGSYKDHSNAANRVSAFETSYGFKAFYRYEAVEGKGGWYRVYVGRFDSRSEAEERAKELMGKHAMPHYSIRTVEQDTDGYYLHVSSYMIRIQAEEEVQRLEQQGFKAFFAEEEVFGKRWFRVYIGTFSDERHARRIGTELNMRGIISFFRPKESPRRVTAAKKTALLGKEEDDHPQSIPDGKSAEEEKGGAYYDFGVFAYEDGDYEDAEKNLVMALKFDPDDPFCNHFLGKTYLKMERYQQAENCLNKAWKANPDMSGLPYDLAFLNYKMSEYSKAAELFAEIAKEDPSNVLAYYHAGISLYKLERFGKALDYFIGAAEMSPSVRANGYYYAGICYWKMGEIEKAAEKFQCVREQSESESLRQYALKWLEGIEKHKKALQPYSLFLKIGYQYDDNVRLEPLDEDMYADEDDYVIVGYFSGRYDFVNRQYYKIGAGYSHYQTWHDDLGEYDLLGSIFSLYSRYRLNPFTFGFSYVPSHYWLDSDRYLRRHQLNADVMWKVDEKISTRLSYTYYDNNNYQNNDRDGHTNDVFLYAYYRLLDKTGHLFGGIGYEDNSASHRDEYYAQVKTKLGVSLKIPWDLDLSLTGRYYDKKYDHVDSFYGLKREDAKYYASISLSRRLIYDWLNGCVEFNYTKNNSNITDYDYERKVTTLSVIARY